MHACVQESRLCGRVAEAVCVIVNLYAKPPTTWKKVDFLHLDSACEDLLLLRIGANLHNKRRDAEWGL